MDKKAEFLLRIGLAFVFLYAAIGALRDPVTWIGYVPRFVDSILPAETFLTLHALGEIALALWLISGWRIFWAAVLAAFSAIGIVIFNLGALDIVFRDIAIAFSALALAHLVSSGQGPQIDERETI